MVENLLFLVARFAIGALWGSLLLDELLSFRVNLLDFGDRIVKSVKRQN